MSVMDCLLSLNIPRPEAGLVSQLTQTQLKLCNTQAAIQTAKTFYLETSVMEWYSERQHTQFSAIGNRISASLQLLLLLLLSQLPQLPLPVKLLQPFMHNSEWNLDSKHASSPSLFCAREVYLGINALPPQHPPNVCWPPINFVSKILGNPWCLRRFKCATPCWI